MFEITVLIPLADNSGEVFAPEHHDAFERVLLDAFGGCSRLPGEVAGKWLDADRVYTDRLVAYVVAVKSIVDASKVGEVVAFAKAHYRQEAVYLRYLGQAEIL